MNHSRKRSQSNSQDRSSSRPTEESKKPEDYKLAGYRAVNRIKWTLQGYGDCLRPVGGGGYSYNGLYGKVPPERGTFLRLQV